MAERKDYSGDFDPEFRFEDLSKEALVRLVREYALIAQLLDRSVFAAVALRYGPQAVAELAIEEWRGASPVYTERIRKIMNIEGDGRRARPPAGSRSAAGRSSSTTTPRCCPRPTSRS